MYLFIFVTVAVCNGAYVKVWGQLWELVPPSVMWIQRTELALMASEFTYEFTYLAI